MKMDKKTLIIVIVIGVVVLGGAFYGYRQWQQQRMVAQVVNSIYGGALVGNPLAGGKITQQMAEEIAKQAVADDAQQKKEAAAEAAQTPEDKYNATQEAGSIGTFYQVASTVIKPKIVSVFGKAKITGYNSYGVDGGFIAMFKVPRVVVPADMSGLAKIFADEGYAVISESADSESATVMLQKEGVALVDISYDDQGQDQEVSVIFNPLQPTTE